MATVENNSKALSLIGKRLSNACIISYDEVESILVSGLLTLDECEEVDGVYCYSPVDILNAVASAIWSRIYDCGYELQGGALMTHAVNAWR
jgi:hypothetical protein